jgi:hypothetical protein
VRNGFTEVLGGGTITTSGTYRLRDGLCTLTGKITCAGGATIASTAGVGSFLSGAPFAAAANAAGHWVNSTTVAASGGVEMNGNSMYVTNAWAAAGNTFDFTVTYPV